MKRHTNKIVAIKDMIKGLEKDLRISFGDNVHIREAMESIEDELIILEQRISQQSNAHI